MGDDHDKFAALFYLVEAALEGLTLHNRLAQLHVKIRKLSTELERLQSEVRKYDQP